MQFGRELQSGSFFLNMNYSVLLFSLFVVLVHCFDEDVEVVLLPNEWSYNNATVPLRFTAFGKNVDLVLEKNENLIAPNFEVWKREEDNGLRRIVSKTEISSCHYLHGNSFSSAAVSLCDEGSVQGFVFLENDSLEITPLSNDEPDIFEKRRIKVRSSTSFGEPHVIKRRRISPYLQSQVFNARGFKLSPRYRETSSSVVDKDKEKGKPKERITSPLTIELAVFFDEAAYRIFQPHFSNDDEKLLDMLLAYINNIQALYYHPSLGIRMNIALVHLELMQTQPEELATMDGERGELLDAFCSYSNKQNPIGDENPGHWDIGLYISGLDFYSMENGKKNPITMGLAPVGGVCWKEYACVIAEFGVTNRFGKPYPSAGFTSVYIAAHEIAHNLGMHHDSSGNDCPKDGFIMSPSRGTQGETHWSSCSRTIALSLPTTKKCLLDQVALNYRIDAHRHLDHSGRFSEVPGRHWSAKRQCEVLLRDREAYVDDIKDCCRALRCRTPNRTGFYLAGPALDGTKCAIGQECKAGECLPIEDNWIALPPITPPPTILIGWSEWRESACESGCIRGSLGFQERRRTCLGDSECLGLSFDVSLCKDAHICKKRKRLTVLEYAGRRCLEFGKKLDIIDGVAGGLQAQHEVDRPWMACAIFCKKKDIASYYSPRLELNDLGVDSYFPDGTWCHKDEDGENYFCRRHHCLPEKFRFGKGLPKDEDDDLGPMNAGLFDYWNLPSEVIRYFSLDINGKPLSTKIESRLFEPPVDGEPWLDTKDYIEIEQTAMRQDKIDTSQLIM